MRLAALLLPLAVCANAPHTATPRVDVLVIAPHPDDEVLLAGGALDRAVRTGQHAAVIIVTNGDYTCSRDGYRRQAESVSALTALGLKEEDIHFMGYPDGHLAHLGPKPLGPVEHRAATGECTTIDHTWAVRGAARVDEHTRRTGRAAELTSDHLAEDLAALLDELRPHDVYLPHIVDRHPDHSEVYRYFRRAIDALGQSPRIHRGVVHSDRCWPSECHGWLTPELAMPTPEDLVGVPEERLRCDPSLKRELIEHYPSQTGDDPDENWLIAFARVDELTFPEPLVRRGQHHVDADAVLLVPVTGRWRLPPFDLTIDAQSVVVSNEKNHDVLATWPRSQVTLLAGSRWSLDVFGPGGFVTQVPAPH